MKVNVWLLKIKKRTERIREQPNKSKGWNDLADHFIFGFYVRWNYVVAVASGIYEEDLPCVGIKLITVRRKLNWSLTFVSSGSECSSQNT